MVNVNCDIINSTKYAFIPHNIEVPCYKDIIIIELESYLYHIFINSHFRFRIISSQVKSDPLQRLFWNGNHNHKKILRVIRRQHDLFFGVFVPHRVA